MKLAPIFFVSFSVASVAQGDLVGDTFYANTYAVVNHSTCGNTNLPNTAPEIVGFLTNLPKWLNKNFYYKDADVWANDWKAKTDLYKAGTKNGLDGADSAFISYIATHGVTDNDVFYISAGGDEKGGGCSANTRQFKLGDGGLRNLFLSACQSIKIGTGINPSAPGADPAAVWLHTEAARGLSCIYGYSSNSVDSDKYGSLFWEKHQKYGPTTAFLTSSWAVSPDQVPAVACFGVDQTEAEKRLNLRTFDESPGGYGYMSWAWFKTRSISGSLKLSNMIVSNSVPCG
jgi:hypothetical protein